MTVVRGCGSDPRALRYRTELVKDAGPDCPTNDIIRVVWCGTSNATAENAVDPESPEVKSREAQAAQLIKNLLRDPPYRKPSKECEQFLTSEGFDIEDGGQAKAQSVPCAQACRRQDKALSEREVLLLVSRSHTRGRGTQVYSNK